MNSSQADLISRIRQKKLDSLATKHLHVKRRDRLNFLNQSIDVLAIVVPGIYLAVRYVAKGTAYGPLADFFGEILAALLLGLTITKMLCHWPDKAQEHSKLLGDNITVIGVADSLLADPASIATQMSLFSVLVQKSELDDRNLLGTLKPKEKQAAYREGLKELEGEQVKCPHCHSSPWNFTPGTCQLCGNKPTNL